MNLFKNQKALALLAVLLVVWLGWHLAGQASFVSGSEWRFKLALLSIVYVSILSVMSSLAAGGTVWFFTRRKIFVPVFALSAVVLFNSQDYGPMRVLPDVLGRLGLVYYTLPAEYLNELQGGPEYNFRKARWGMSEAEIRAAESELSAEEVQAAGPDGLKTLRYGKVDCLGFKAELRYLFEKDGLVGAEYELLPRHDRNFLLHRLEDIYGKHVFRFKIDNIQRYFWDAGGSEIYLDLPVSAQSKQRTKLYFVSKQSPDFFGNLE